MKTHAKAWLWIMLVANILGALTYIRLTMLSAIYGAFLIAEVAMVVSVCLLLFKRMKLGFYLLCGICVITFFLNLYMHINLIAALMGMIGGPIITFLFLQSSWDSLS